MLEESVVDVSAGGLNNVGLRQSEKAGEAARQKKAVATFMAADQTSAARKR